jgi:hypothetical protein
MKIGMASLLEYFAYLIERKSGRLRAGCHRVNISAHVSRPPLGFELSDIHWLRRQLKDRSLLALTQRCQEHDSAIRKLQRIVMSDDLFFVNLPKDCCLVLDYLVVPRPQSSCERLTSSAKANSVPGRTHTATLGFSDAANPRVPVPKSCTVSLSPILAGRDLTL